MTTMLTKQDIRKMRKEIGERSTQFPVRKHWDVNRIVKTLEHFYDELICEGCFNPYCGQKEEASNKKEKTLIFKTLDGFIEDMSFDYVVSQILKWIIEQWQKRTKK